MSGIAIVFNTLIHFDVFFGDCVMYLMLPFISFFIFFDKEMGVFRTSVKNITLLLCADKHFELGVKTNKGNIYIMIGFIGVYILHNLNLNIKQ